MRTSLPKALPIKVIDSQALESVLAKWIPFEGLSKIKNWRGEELLEWAAYLE